MGYNLSDDMIVSGDRVNRAFLRVNAYRNFQVLREEYTQNMFVVELIDFCNFLGFEGIDELCKAHEAGNQVLNNRLLGLIGPHRKAIYKIIHLQNHAPKKASIKL